MRQAAPQVFAAANTERYEDRAVAGGVHVDREGRDWSIAGAASSIGGWLQARHFAANQPSASGNLSGEAAWLRVRYKLPGEAKSLLIEQPITTEALQAAQAPKGDAAFATAVAAFGQILRQDPMLGAFDMSQVRALAGPQSNYLRAQFLELTRAAENSSAPY